MGGRGPKILNSGMGMAAGGWRTRGQSVGSALPVMSSFVLLGASPPAPFPSQMWVGGDPNGWAMAAIYHDDLNDAFALGWEGKAEKVEKTTKRKVGVGSSLRGARISHRLINDTLLYFHSNQIKLQH